MRFLVLVSVLVLSDSWLARAAVANNGYITYNVVAMPSDPKTNVLGVAIGQDIYPLAKDKTVPLLYTGQAPGGQPYRYVTMESPASKEVTDNESFERPAIMQATKTFNEVYGRPWNKLEVPELPHLYDFAPYVTYNKSKLFEEGIIATVHIEADEEQVQNMHANKLEKGVSVTGKLTYISYDDIQQIDQVKFKASGHSSRDWAKMPYKIKIGRKAAPGGLYNQFNLKLRSETSDPTMLREKLYSDMLESSGVLAPHSSYVRLYINDMPVGLYLLVDNAGTKSFVREYIHGGNVTQLGSLIKGDAGKGSYSADLAYLGPNADAYDSKVYHVAIEEPEGKTSAMDNLIAFMSYIQDYDTSTVARAPLSTILDKWGSKMDVVRFVHMMAMEFIGGNWDGIQYSGNNFVLYRHPQTQQYIVIPMDFDFTFGSGLEKDQRQLMTGTLEDFTGNRNVHSYLWDKLKDIPAVAALYKQSIREMADSIGHPDKVLSRVDALAYMIQHDVVWDRSLERLSEGKTKPWSGEKFLDYLEQGPGDVDEQIGLKEWIRSKHEAIKSIMDPHAAEQDHEEAASGTDETSEEESLEQSDNNSNDDVQVDNLQLAAVTQIPSVA